MTDKTLELFSDRSLIVCIGPGGVGKTTTAAALALKIARSGKRTLVITIDPAKRLAGALGVDSLDDTEKQVAGEPNLYAAMLDVKKSYDALITRVASEAARERIFENRVYQGVSRSLARSHAYVAMERLFDCFETGKWDAIVLDTPPTRSALEILDAPGRLVRFLDQGILSRFVPSQGSRFTTNLATKFLSLLVGQKLVNELVDFFSVIGELRGGFQDRADAMRTLLFSDKTAFVLIANTSTTSLADAQALASEIEARGRKIDHILFNKSYTREPGTVGTPVQPASSNAPAVVSKLRSQLISANQKALNAAKTFCQAHDKAVGLILPRLDEDFQSLEQLEDMLRAPLYA